LGPKRQEVIYVVRDNSSSFLHQRKPIKKEENFEGLTELSKKFREIIKETRGKNENYGN